MALQVYVLLPKSGYVYDASSLSSVLSSSVLDPSIVLTTCLLPICAPTLLMRWNAEVTDLMVSGSAPVGLYIASRILSMFCFKYFSVASLPVRKT